MSRVRVLVERGCSHEVSDDDSHWCRPTTEPLTEFPPEAVEAAAEALFYQRHKAFWVVQDEDYKDIYRRRATSALAAALEAITKEDE